MTQDNSEQVVIRVENLGKCYRIYDTPKDRLKQALWRGNRKYYREFWALRDVSFEVRRGETLGIIGRNGSGKSTLLQMICGTLTPTEGTVQTHGTVAALLELGSGFNPEFTGIENVYLNALLHGLSREQAEDRLEDIQAFADIGEFIHQPVRTYSSGMLVRLAFAVIAHVDAAVLIVDEALSVGDAVFGQRCMRFIRRFKETGTLLFVSHDMNAVSSLCEKAAWIDSGQMKMHGETISAMPAYTRFCFESAEAETKAQEDSDNHPIPNPSSDNLDQQAIMGQWDSDGDWGNRNAIISNAELLNKSGEPTASPECGETVTLRITAHCANDIDNFMAGFIIRDRTGMIILGENNINHGNQPTKAKAVVEVDFEFTMPFLAPGSYTISPGISQGDPDTPTVMHYKPDKLIVHPLLHEKIVHGIFAIPNTEIRTRIMP
jgi:lipopolysaccharide transport system ATP-binding protein